MFVYCISQKKYMKKNYIKKKIPSDPLSKAISKFLQDDEENGCFLGENPSTLYKNK